MVSKSGTGRTWALLLGLAGVVQGAPRDIQIREVNLATGVLELHNYGTSDELLDGWQFCSHDDNQALVYSSFTGLNGVTIEAGTSFFIHYNNDGPGGADARNRSQIGSMATPLDQGPYSIALYFPPVNFANGNQIADHLQWNIDGAHNNVADERSDEAVSGGVWTAVTDWIATTPDTIIVRLLDASGGQVLHGPEDYEIVEGSGACCDRTNEICFPGQTESSCEDQGFEFGGEGSSCEDFDPVCAAAVDVGACCDEIRGTCGENTPADDCTGHGLRFGGIDSTCADFDPPCVQPISIGLEVVAGGGGSAAARSARTSPVTGRQAGRLRAAEPAVGGGGGTLTAPLLVTHAGDGSGRLFVVDQIGLIRVIDENDNLLATPFLDIRDRMVSVGVEFAPGFVFDERGLLGLAFHPDFETNGKFYVRYSASRCGTTGFPDCDPLEPCDPSNFPFNTVSGDPVGCHKEVLSEFSVTGDPTTNNEADPTSEVVLFEVDEPEFNHNSGHVEFGPDGLLYWTLGDGGGANDDQHLNGLCDAGTCADSSTCSVSAQDCGDASTCVSDEAWCTVGETCNDGSACLAAGTTPHGPDGNAQNTDTALGNILRIDVTSAPDTGLPYHVPAGNPFADGVDGLPEIYAYGFRNPYRFSFGNIGGQDLLIVGDVGQNLFEEVDLVPVLATPPLLNYGWVVREGSSCFDPFDPACPPPSCPNTGPFGETMEPPVLDYGHNVGIAVVGGSIYSGSYPPLQGKYVFGDFSQDFGPTGRLLYADVDGPEAFVLKEFFLAPDGAPLGQAMFGLGEDEAGEMYVCASDNIGPVGSAGVVYRITAPTPSNATMSSRYLSVQPPPSPDPFAIAVTLDCPGGTTKFAGPPFEVVTNSGLEKISLLVDDPADAARLSSDEWGEAVHITGADVLPEASYQLQTDFGTAGSPFFSGASMATMNKLGDNRPPFGGADQPNVVDVTGLVDKFRDLATAPPLHRADLVGLASDRCPPNQSINVADVTAAVDGFRGIVLDCPSSCP